MQKVIALEYAGAGAGWMAGRFPSLKAAVPFLLGVLGAGLGAGAISCFGLGAYQVLGKVPQEMTMRSETEGFRLFAVGFVILMSVISAVAVLALTIACLLRRKGLVARRRWVSGLIGAAAVLASSTVALLVMHATGSWDQVQGELMTAAILTVLTAVSPLVLQRRRPGDVRPPEQFASMVAAAPFLAGVLVTGIGMGAVACFGMRAYQITGRGSARSAGEGFRLFVLGYGILMGVVAAATLGAMGWTSARKLGLVARRGRVSFGIGVACVLGAAAVGLLVHLLLATFARRWLWGQVTGEAVTALVLVAMAVLSPTVLQVEGGVTAMPAPCGSSGLGTSGSGSGGESRGSDERGGELGLEGSGMKAGQSQTHP